MEIRLGCWSKLYKTERRPLQTKIVRMHFFTSGSDWYAVEYDADRRVFFGFVILNNDRTHAEWGYFSLDELRTVRLGPFPVERDLQWRPRKGSDVDRIAAASGWRREGGRESAGINRSGVANERVVREKSSQPLGPEPYAGDGDVAGVAWARGTRGPGIQLRNHHFRVPTLS